MPLDMRILHLQAKWLTYTTCSTRSIRVIDFSKLLLQSTNFHPLRIIQMNIFPRDIRLKKRVKKYRTFPTKL